jgi:hypothetical protein
MALPREENFEFMDPTAIPTLPLENAVELLPFASPAVESSTDVREENAVITTAASRRGKFVSRKPAIPKEMQVVFSVTANE